LIQILNIKFCPTWLFFSHHVWPASSYPLWASGGLRPAVGFQCYLQLLWRIPVVFSWNSHMWREWHMAWRNPSMSA